MENDRLTPLQRMGISYLLMKYRESGYHWLDRGKLTFEKIPYSQDARITNMYVTCNDHVLVISLQNEYLNDSYVYKVAYDPSERLFHIIDDIELKVVNAD